MYGTERYCRVKTILLTLCLAFGRWKGHRSWCIRAPGKDVSLPVERHV